MPDTALLKPIFALVLLSFAVVTRLLWVRTRAVMEGEVKMSYYKDLSGSAPAVLIANAKNFSNLFEMPVLFYAVTILVMITQRSDPLYLGAAWVYVALRYAHSAIHLTSNQVMARVVAYGVSNLTLVFLWGRFAIQMW